LNGNFEEQKTNQNVIVDYCEYFLNYYYFIMIEKIIKGVKTMSKKIILASSSPFRRQLLEKTGLPFDVIKPDYEENITISSSPEEIAKILSEGKAQSVAKIIDYDAIVIGSDQIFVYDGKIEGKVENRYEAFNRLKMLSGNEHKLISGLSVIDTRMNIIKTIADTVKIFIRKLTDDEINKYLDTNEWKGVAGSYRIEGKGVSIIEKIEGDYYSVIGLPLFKLISILKDMNIPII